MGRNVQSSIRNEDLLAKRRQEIVVASARLFVTQGFERTSVRQIAKACGLTVGGLYRYVGSKDEILWMTTLFGDFAQENLLEKMRERVRGMRSFKALKESISVYFHSVDELQDLYNFHNHVVGTSSKEFMDTIFAWEMTKIGYFTHLVEEGIKSGDFVADDARLVAHNIVIAANAWANRRWYLRKSWTLDDYIRKETDYVLTAIQSKRSGRSVGNGGNGSGVTEESRP